MVDILARDGFEFLTSVAPDALPRHQSLHTVFATSWSLSGPTAQRTLARLSVFRGGAGRQALLAVTGATLADLQTLVGQSLLWRKGAGRYEMHDLLRQFAATQLAVMERSSANDRPVSDERHADYYLTLVGTIVGKGLQAKAVLAVLQEEIDNIRRDNDAGGGRLRTATRRSLPPGGTGCWTTTCTRCSLPKPRKHSTCRKLAGTARVSSSYRRLLGNPADCPGRVSQHAYPL